MKIIKNINGHHSDYIYSLLHPLGGKLSENTIKII